MHIHHRALKRALKITGWILLVLIAVAVIAWFGFLKPKPLPVSPGERAQITLIPLPADLKIGSGAFILDENLVHEFTRLTTPRLERATKRFFSRLSSQTGMELGKGTERSLKLECTGTGMMFPSFGDDESYTIRISRNQIRVKAPSETGIIYGLETILQLAEERNGKWVLPVLTMNDHPRFGWRGIMIDACRHWIPEEVILRNLDAMGMAKMNVLHWHLTDHQGFRVESKAFPGLHEMGSNGEYYTREEILEVIEYAADRGIRVVPEFDLPGHSQSWFVGYPELASAPGPYLLDTLMMVTEPVMDPASEEVYLFLDQFLGEMALLFPDEYIHMGGDEVSTSQWENNPDIRRFMEEHGIEDPPSLQAYFNLRIQEILDGHGKKMMGWDEILHPDLAHRGIAVQTWRDHGSLWETARQGNMAILSAGYYLDHKQPASFHYLVDPTVIPGAVDIEIDSTRWKGWECTLKVSDMVMEGALFLFGDGNQLQGIMNFMGSPMAFGEASADGENLSFALETNMGRVDFETVISGDSITGTAKISFFTLELTGTRSGGSDMTHGVPLPEFRKMDPLTPGEESMLVGGEACMWSEMVDGTTIESRIWPRAAAIGEKLWSPGPLTDDVKDLYRRLMVFDHRLESQGLKHRSYRDQLLSDMAGAPYRDALRILVGALEEDKLFNRMVIYSPELYTTTPLNRVVDASPAENYEVYRFGEDVELWLEFSDGEARSRILRIMQIWARNHEKLAPAFETSQRLKEVEAHSVNLARLGDLGMQAISDPGSLAGRDEEIEALFVSASAPHGGTILPVAGPVKKLVDSAMKK